MRKLALFLPMALMLVACQGEGPRQVEPYTVEQFYDTTLVFGGSFSPDDSAILFSSNESGIYNAYTVPVGGGEPTPLTASTANAVVALSYFPADGRILYRSDDGGNEIWHIFLREEDGAVRDLTPWDGARAVFHGFSHDGKSFFFESNRRDSKHMDLYEMDVEEFAPRLVYRNDGGYEIGAVSNDKRYVALEKTITTNNSDMYLYDGETEKHTHLTPHEGDVRFSPQTFSADSRGLLYLTDEGGEFDHLVRHDIAGGGRERVDEADWDITSVEISHDGTYRVVSINNDASTEIRVVETATDRPVELASLPEGQITSVTISRSEKRMSFYVNGSTSPNNLHVHDLETGRQTKLTDTMNTEIEEDDLVRAEVIRYRSFDGLEIPAIYYRPHQIPQDGTAPALVWVHGGPGGQSRTGYNPLLQYLANHGYVVLAVNNRGSSGYGKTFHKLDDRKHGEEDLADCIAAKKFLASTGYVDESRIGIIGGSYGGYMVLAALTFEPEEFAVGVDLFGISNWVRTLESIPSWWESFREALYAEMGNPEADRDYLHRISPLFHSERIVRPLMVLQGANDPRVIQVESDDIVARARENGVPVEYLVFEDEGHGFRKRENQIEGYRAIRVFLDAHLKSGAATPC